MPPLKLAAHYGCQVLTDFENVGDNRRNFNNLNLTMAIKIINLKTAVISLLGQSRFAQSRAVKGVVSAASDQSQSCAASAPRRNRWRECYT